MVIEAGTEKRSKIVSVILEDGRKIDIPDDMLHWYIEFPRPRLIREYNLKESS